MSHTQPDAESDIRAALLAAQAEPDRLGSLMEQQRDRLKKLVAFRMDRRLRQRIDPSDVIQETFAEAHKRLPEYLERSNVPFFLWLRLLTQQRLATVTRHHLGRVGRDAERDVSLDNTSGAIAVQLVGQRTDPGDAAARAEMCERLKDALEAMNETDREVLALRHFEELSNVETAAVLGIEPAAASKRYVRALEKLRDIMDSLDSSNPKEE
jgi:RNA polymerase sigma-70 factor (ECF subfamily)